MNTDNIIYKIHTPPTNPKMIFKQDGKWIMELSGVGIRFNTKDFPVDKIAEDVINVICESFWPYVSEIYEKKKLSGVVSQHEKVL